MSDRNHLVSSSSSSSSSSDSFGAFNDETDPPSDPGRGFREGLPPAFRMRADAHYVEQLDGAASVAVQYIAVHAIDVSDAPADALPELVESIKRYGVLEPLVVQRNNGTYKTITGQKRLAAARAAGLRDVPCLVHHVSDERAQMLRDVLRSPATQETRASAQPSAPLSASATVFDVAVAAIRLVGDVSDGQVSVVRTAMGPRLTIDLPFTS